MRPPCWSMLFHLSVFSLPSAIRTSPLQQQHFRSERTRRSLFPRMPAASFDPLARQKHWKVSRPASKGFQHGLKNPLSKANHEWLLGEINYDLKSPTCRKTLAAASHGPIYDHHFKLTTCHIRGPSHRRDRSKRYGSRQRTWEVWIHPNASGAVSSQKFFP